jgi:hypothetical protein
MGALGDRLRGTAGEVDGLEAAAAQGQQELAAAQVRITELEAELAAARPMAPPLTGFAQPMAPSTTNPPSGDPPPGFDGRIVVAHWARLEPAEGQLDESYVQAVADYMARVPSGLRVLFGRYAPAWAKGKFGSVMLTETFDGIGTVPVECFWRPARNAHVFERFLPMLGARLAPVTHHVHVCSQMTFYGEPCIRVESNAATYRAAGYTVAEDKAGLLGSILAYREAFPATRLAMSFNPFQNIAVAGADMATTYELMDALRAAQPGAILQNNSIGEYTPTRDAMYEQMKVRGGSIAFQTERQDRMGDQWTTFQRCIGYGASLVETHPTELSTLTQAQIDEIRAALTANAG